MYQSIPCITTPCMQPIQGVTGSKSFPGRIMGRDFYLAPHSQQVCRFFIQDIFLGTVFEAIFKSNFKNFNEQLAQSTARYR